MITKRRRLAVVQELVNLHPSNNQSKLLKLLHERGFKITQTTLSRDIKQLKICKVPNDKGDYLYTNPKQETTNLNRSPKKNKINAILNRGFISFEFSYQFGIIKTHTGYANLIASDIDSLASPVITGTIASENTVLIIPREGVSREDVFNTLEMIIPAIKKESEEI